MAHKIKENHVVRFGPPSPGGARKLTVPTMWLPAITMTDLPVPPSANAMYRTSRIGTRRFKTQRYKDWQQEFAALVLRLLQDPNVSPEKRPRACREKHPLYILITANVDYRRDLDNLVKPILDTMQVIEMIPDDRYADIIEIHRSTLADKDTFSIIVHELKKEVTDQEMKDVLALDSTGTAPVLH